MALSACVASMCLLLGAPPTLLDVADYVAATSYKTHNRDVVCFDCFSGQRSISQAFSRKNQNSVYFDLATNPRHDICTTDGFCLAVLNVLKLAPDGILSMGPPCGSYIWMNRATSCRSRENPYGDQSREYVERASMICVRALLLLILATARGAYVVLEQPASSVMKFMPDFVATAKLIQKHLGLWNEQFFWMASWGAPSAKPSRVWGTPFWLPKLYVKLSQLHRLKLLNLQLEITKKKRNADGQVSVSGGKDLKRTQVYPRGYGVRIQALQDDLRDTKRNYLQACIKKACSKMKQKGVKPVKRQGAWQKADLPSLKKFVLKWQTKGKR